MSLGLSLRRAAQAAVFVFLSPVAALAESPATAPAVSAEVQAPGPAKDDSPAVVVTANRIETPVWQVGSSVTIITGEEIARRQQPLVADVLRTVPSLDIARSGGNNQITSVFTRGSESSHTLVLIDGIEANDPTSPNRAFDFSTLTTDNVDRIEVARGPQSTLWGSNAMGGVINIITRRGEGPLNGFVFAEAGSYRTFREGATIGGSMGKFNYSGSFTQQNSKGFSAADEKYGNTEDDGFGSTNFSTRLGYQFSKQLDVDFIARYQHSRIDIDDFGGPGGDDPHRQLKNDQGFFRLQPHLVLMDGKWEQTFGLSYTVYNRVDTDNAFPDDVDGGILRFDYQSNIKLAKWNTLTFGLAADEENFASKSIERRTADSLGIFVQDSVTLWEKLFLTAGVRYEDHSISEASWTYRMTGAYYVLPETRVHASLGTGYKAPSLSNLYSNFGSPDLRPEKVTGWDAGVEQQFLKGRLAVDATYFHNSFDNLIDFNFATSHLENVGASTTQGFEFTLSARPTDTLSCAFSYTYTNTLNTETDQELLRRAPNKFSLSTNWRYCPRGDVTLTLVYSGSRADIDPITFGRTRIGAYTLLNLATSYRIADNVTLYARIDNALDRDYEEVAGFGTAHVSAYAGVKVSF